MAEETKREKPKVDLKQVTGNVVEATRKAVNEAGKAASGDRG